MDEKVISRSTIIFPADTTRWINVVLMLGQRRGRLANI